VIPLIGPLSRPLTDPLSLPLIGLPGLLHIGPLCIPFMVLRVIHLIGPLAESSTYRSSKPFFVPLGLPLLVQVYAYCYNTTGTVQVHHLSN
jgi:hypothetical protein